ncbi:MAG: hypothetical protein WC775_05840 [Patescibacteria group bacterium]|jgi:hypothetical protein
MLDEIGNVAEGYRRKAANFATSVERSERTTPLSPNQIDAINAYALAPSGREGAMGKTEIPLLLQDRMLIAAGASRSTEKRITSQAGTTEDTLYLTDVSGGIPGLNLDALRGVGVHIRFDHKLLEVSISNSKSSNTGEPSANVVVMREYRKQDGQNTFAWTIPNETGRNTSEIDDKSLGSDAKDQSRVVDHVIKIHDPAKEKDAYLLLEVSVSDLRVGAPKIRLNVIPVEEPQWVGGKMGNPSELINRTRQRLPDPDVKIF